MRLLGYIKRYYRIIIPLYAEIDINAMTSSNSRNCRSNVYGQSSIYKKVNYC